LRHLVNRLNEAGTGPRELGQILMTIKAGGALQAEIIIS
jgi:flagellar basal body P-ring protein FlgI